MNQVKNIKNKIVSDLAWLISSPPLIVQKNNLTQYPDTIFFQKLWEDNKKWIMNLDDHPQALFDYLVERKTYQLGRYCENLLSFFFIQSPQYELLENNLQICNITTTLGEVDYLVKEINTGQTIHIELAVKFYISKNNYPSIDDFIGPNGNDRLDLKLKKINQQIKITDTYPEIFEKYIGSETIQKKIFFKGMLFYKEHLSIEDNWLNEQHLRGNKLLFDSADFKISKNSKYYFPHKLEWLTLPSDIIFLDYIEAIKKIEELLKRRIAILVYEKNEHSINKFFIVDSKWPKNNTII